MYLLKNARENISCDACSSMSLALYLIDQKASSFYMQADFLFCFCFCRFLIEDRNLSKEEKIKPIHIYKKIFRV